MDELTLGMVWFQVSLQEEEIGGKCTGLGGPVE